ncbi:MAG: tRNA-dihydrouridine synthase [Candidatus Pacebacteria bacterium]|nr:tRNA-dihydrouridine synthase [Candidatus Paceibacterota bacterium]
MNFWETLPRPFFVLAPLANVTDAAFRRVIAKYSKPAGPHVMYTEFVAADGLVRATEEGKAKLMRDLVFSEAERPIVAQFFTANPEHMEKAAALARELGFDGVDINMGCPDRSIEKQGAGAKLILNPTLARELVAAAKRGAGDLPVSVKTRLGYNKDILDEWLPEILKAEPVVLILHARTRKEMSKVDAHWDRVKRAVEIRNELGSKTLIVGNGDVKNLDDARQKAAESGADGIMLGRAIFGTPWLFNPASELAPPSSSIGKVLGSPVLPESGQSGQTISSTATRLRVAIEHTKLFEELLGDIKNFAIMKKHFKAYVEGFHGAKELRVQLMEAKNADEVETIVENFLKEYTGIHE